MSYNEEDNSGVPLVSGDDESRSAVNSLILDYYKKFGRKRDLEQYFSLSTAQSDIRDPSSEFWSKMKAENESSDSGERSDKKSESSRELCRISIRFPQDPCSSQEEDSKTKSESVSPPIIIEEMSQDSKQNSDDEALKSDDNNSQKSYDVILDTSMNKPHSPSSSITSQRKLEWDSLADVGYANESDRKTSASSLSTLERLALKQQYSNNDTQKDNSLGFPTAHSTPLDETEIKFKSKKGVGKKSTKIYQKDVDFVEVNVPHLSNINPSQSINVNLTKHISFNVEKDGKITVDNVQKDVKVSPEKISLESEASAKTRIDKEMQTSLTKESNGPSNVLENVPLQSTSQKIPIMISLNTLRNRLRKRKLRMARRKLRSKKRADKENIPIQEKTGEQLSEAESFEYMPGHIYNQNQMTANDRPSNVADNKSSLESSGILTTDSSKGSKHSFAKDLEKSIDLLKAALQQRCDDSTLRKQLIKQVCQRLLKSKYRDDDSTTDFLSGLSFSSKKLGLGERNNTTTSTSDANNSTESTKRPKKSILRTDKFNPGPIASTSQSVPNLPVASNCEKLVTSELTKNMTTSNTDSDVSSKEKTSSDNVCSKTSSEELYKKYLQALKREEAYKKHLKDKEMFLRQKLVSSDGAFKVPVRVEAKPSHRLKDLMNDLTRNNYDDGSGDASKLEGGPGSNSNFNRFLPNRNQRSHSVFTLSSENSCSLNKKSNLKKRLQCDIKKLSKPGPSKDSHYCCCPHHLGNLKFCDSSVQVNLKSPCSVDGQQTESPRNLAQVDSGDVTGNMKYVCLCNRKSIQEVPDNFLMYKCSRLTNKGTQLEETSSKASDAVYIQCNNETCDKSNIRNFPSTSKSLNNKSSQTNMLIKMPQENNELNDVVTPLISTSSIYEATRCIQTEISINPKISDPTLSDINIVSDTNCAKVISEHSREFSKHPLTEEVYYQGKDCPVSTKSSSYKSSGTSKNAENDLEDNATEKAKSENKNQKQNIEQTENFTIPIHGTNMTLMVSIGSECRVCPHKNTEEMIAQCIGTDKVNTVEQATCLTEECSKGVQFNKMPDDSDAIDHNSNKIGDDYQNTSKITDTSQKSRIANLTTDEFKFATYPKTSSVNEQKPFRRSSTNTDTVQTRQFLPKTINTNCQGNKVDTNKKCSGKIFSDNTNQQDEKCFCGCKGLKQNCKKSCKERKSSPRDNIKQPCGQKVLLDIEGEKSSNACGGLKEISTQTDNLLDSQKGILDNKSKQCPCGCGDPKCNCKENCMELKSISKELCKKQTSGKQLSNQEDSPNEQSEKCSCGCSGTKDNCKRSCKELKLLPKNQCGIQSEDDEISIQKDISSNRNEKCPCGCGGQKNTCRKSCKELSSLPKKQCEMQTIEQKSIEKDISLKHSEKCMCGCGGLKDNCKKSCKELKSSLRDQSGKQSTDKQIDTQTDMLLNQSEMCPCGCGDTKDNCKECKLTPREQNKKQSVDKTIDTPQDFTNIQNQKCSCGCGGSKDNCKKTCKELKLSPRGLSKQHDKKEVGTQKDTTMGGELLKSSRGCRRDEEPIGVSPSVYAQNFVTDEHVKTPLKEVNSRGEQTDLRSTDKDKKSTSETEQVDPVPDPILNMIQNITKKYTKKEVEKGKRKKCFKEIMTVLNYLLETEFTDPKEDQKNMSDSTTTAEETDANFKKISENTSFEKVSKKLVDKGIQLSSKEPKSHHFVTESSDLPVSTDMPATSSDSATCKVLNKIKKECERYHQKRCKIHSGKKCDGTSSTSMNCNQCRRAHHCSCRNNKCKCKGHKKSNDMQKSPIAYNLILQTSESMMSESPIYCDKNRPLKNIIVKVPSKKPVEGMPFKEMAAKFEKHMPSVAPKDAKSCRSRSLPNESEISSIEEIIRKSQGATVREYLEKNRPDFIEKCSQRQSCMRYISESRAIEREVKRDLLSMHFAQLPDVTDLDSDDLRRLAKDLGRHMRQKQPAPKFISEREMKKHSEKIYKSLPEVVQKKEEKRKENIKKTNLLMANMFKKNLQKKTLRGSVNLSNYSTVIKI